MTCSELSAPGFGGVQTSDTVTRTHLWPKFTVEMDVAELRASYTPLRLLPWSAVDEARSHRLGILGAVSTYAMLVSEFANVLFEHEWQSTRRNHDEPNILDNPDA